MRVLFLTLYLSVFLVFASDAQGQLVSDAFCKEIERIVATPYRPAHWYHNIAFSDDCSLEFDIGFKGGVGIKFQLERFSTNREAKESFNSDVEMFEDAVVDGDGLVLTRRKERPRHGFWKQAIFFDSKLLLLRKERSVVTLFCDNRLHCEEIEANLRTTPKLFIF